MPMNVAERFDGAAVWSRLDSEQRDAIGALALEFVAASHARQRAEEDMLDGAAARAADTAYVLLWEMLLGEFVEAVDRGELEAADGSPKLPSLLGMVCRECGCSQTDACADPYPCAWAADSLCTACSGASG